ncbi:Leucine-rich repeat domain, L domain-like [Phytophthora cactorum]|nr:Leucine-rich repeat domain, L domain-like [Phytophthora cactorum]
MLLLIQGVAGQTCGLTASTLSTSCDDACSQYEPCLAYSASSCLQEPRALQPTTVERSGYLYVSSGIWVVREQSREGESSKQRSSFQQQVKAVPDETDTYAAASNDAVFNISAIELQPTVTSFILVGGSSVNSSVKSKVAKVTFGSDVISTQSKVTNVVMNNLDLSTPATLQQLPVVLPTSLQKLSLANTLLSAFPILVANFTSLQNLDLDKNYISEIAATAALNSLVHLSFQDNDLNSFRAVFPNLATLDLTDNNFTDIPASIFIHDSLNELKMKGNPLASPWFTQDQAAFLNELTTFDLENSDFTKAIDSCSTSNQCKVHALTACISDSANDDNDSSDEATTSSSSDVLVIVGSCVGGLLVLGVVMFAGIWLYKRRVRRHDNNRSKVVRESYFGGLSPPLARSPADKGYRGGRRTPVSGGPRFCSDYEYEESNYSPRISTRSTHSNQSSTAYSLWNDEELLSLQVKYEEIEDIAFGIVWLVKYRGSQLLASKRLRSDQVTKQRTQAFIEEIKMVAPLDHPNVVRLLGCAWTIESDLQALFEYMENGDLRDYLVDPSSPRHWNVRGANGNRLNDIAILQLVATGQLRPRFGASCPPELRLLAERCLDQDPDKRPPAHVVAYELRVIQRSHYTLL